MSDRLCNAHSLVAALRCDRINADAATQHRRSRNRTLIQSMPVPDQRNCVTRNTDISLTYPWCGMFSVSASLPCAFVPTASIRFTQPLIESMVETPHRLNPTTWAYAYHVTVPEGSGKPVMFRTALTIVLELEVKVYRFTVLTNDAQPLTSLYCDKNYKVKTSDHWCLKQRVPFSKSHGAPHVLMITAQSVQYPMHLLNCAIARVAVSGPQCLMLFGESVYHYLHSIHRY